MDKFQYKKNYFALQFLILFVFEEKEMARRKREEEELRSRKISPMRNFFLLFFSSYIDSMISYNVKNS